MKSRENRMKIVIVTLGLSRVLSSWHLFLPRVARSDFAGKVLAVLKSLENHYSGVSQDDVFNSGIDSYREWLYGDDRGWLWGRTLAVLKLLFENLYSGVFENVKFNSGIDSYRKDHEDEKK